MKFLYVLINSMYEVCIVCELFLLTIVCLHKMPAKLARVEVKGGRGGGRSGGGAG